MLKNYRCLAGQFLASLFTPSLAILRFHLSFKMGGMPNSVCNGAGYEGLNCIFTRLLKSKYLALVF